MIKKIIDKRASDEPETYFVDELTGHEYRRIIGGFGWPSWKPGFVVVIGEDKKIDEVLGKHHHRIMKEIEVQNASDLIRRAYEAGKKYKVEIFYGDVFKRPMMEFLSGSGDKFRLDAAPYVGDDDAFQAYLSLIREATIPERKRLHFGTT